MILHGGSCADLWLGVLSLSVDRNSGRTYSSPPAEPSPRRSYWRWNEVVELGGTVRPVDDVVPVNPQMYVEAD